MNGNQHETKEEFCGACVMVPLAFAGAGASAYGASGSKKQHKTTKKIVFWIGIATIIISLAIAAYYLWIKNCEDCE